MFTSGFNLPVTSNSSHNTMVPPIHKAWNQHPPESMPWGHLPQHRVTRFSGELDSAQACTAVSNEPVFLWNTPQENWKLMPLSSPIKRKIEDSCDEQIRKQLITEEKISAHLSQLQIGSPSLEQIKSDAMEDDITTTNCLEGIRIDSCSKLVLSEEILNFQRENSIPASLLETFNKPSMAVVLWQPRNTVHQLITSDSISSEEQSCRAAIEENPPNDLELINEDESNNNEPINNFNLNEMASQSDLEMDDL